MNDKTVFAALCKWLDLPVAETIVCTTAEGVRGRDAEVGQLVRARAAFGRGGLDIIYQHRPAGGGPPSKTSSRRPRTRGWSRSSSIWHPDRCSWSVVHEGEVVLHSCYEHPLSIDDRGGIVFQSVDTDASLAAVERSPRRLNWTGQISMDYLVTGDGTHYMVECNPRRPPAAPSPPPRVRQALFDRTAWSSSSRAASGRSGSRWSDALKHPRKLREDHAIAKGSSPVYAQPNDIMPLVCLGTEPAPRAGLPPRGRQGAARERQLVAAQFFDILYDGSPLK